MSKVNTVPLIRFKGFTDAWKQRKLGEEVQIVMGQSPKGENYTDNPEDYILVQGNADMKDGKVFPRVWTTQVTKQAHKGEIILSVRAPVGDIGKTDYDVVIGRGVAAVKGNEFFYQLLGKLKLDGYWTKSSTGSTFDSINSNEIKSAKVTIPDTNEQLLIGDYFQKIDNLITLHQRKYDQVVNFKKAMLEKMFPKDGSDTPEIRFKNFIKNPNLKWSEIVLGENASIITGGTPRTEVDRYWNPKEIPWLSSGEVHKKRVTQTDDKISQEGLKNSSAKWVGKDAILVALAGQGKTRGTVAITEIPITTNQSVAAIELEDSLSPEFVYQNLESRYEELRMKSSGDGTRGGLNKEILSGITIKAPEKTEQIDIGEFLRVLDRLVYLNCQKLIKLKNIKKALLEKMFV